MAYCKKFIILFLILFILFFNFSTVFASDLENVDLSTANGIIISPNSNYFIESSGSYVNYFPVEVGYKYYITNNTSQNRSVVESSSVPTVNANYNFLTILASGETYNYIPNDNVYVYVSTSGGLFTVTREKIPGQTSAINDLVESVGPNVLWGVFGSGLDFVFIVVIVAFGIFIIYKLVRGFSKGKSKI